MDDLTIGFEAKRAFTNRTGLGSYARFVIRSLGRRFPQHRYLVYTPDPRPAAGLAWLDGIGRAAVRTPTGVARFAAGALWRTFGLGRRAARDGVRIFHGLSQELPRDLPPGGPVSVVTMHDMLAVRYPHYYPAIDRRVYLLKARWSTRRARIVVATSEQTGRDLSEFLGVEPEKIRVVYQGTEPRFAVRLSAAAIGDVRRRHGLPEDYVLSVGTIEPRKNALILLQALAALPPDQRPFLVMVGRPTGYLRQLETLAHQAGLDRSWRVLTGVPPEDLPALYQGATLFLYPSRFEGFGIPVLEALRSGVAVVTSTGSCFAEVGGAAARYLDPDDPEALAEAMGSLLGDGAMRQRMVAEGFRQASRFDDDVLADALMNVYTEVLACAT